MTTVTITAEPGTEVQYRARAGDVERFGRTAGEALDAISAVINPATAATLLVLNKYRPDSFFPEASIRELQTLLRRREEANALGKDLAPSELARLEELVEAELQASSQRAAELLTRSSQ